MKKIQLFLTVIILSLFPFLLISCGDHNDNISNDDTDTSEGNTDRKSLKEEALATLTPDPENAFVLNDNVVYSNRVVTPEMLVIVKNDAYHALYYNAPDTPKQVLCDVEGCTHSDIRCTASQGVGRPLMVESDGVTVMYYFDWINGKPEIEGQEIPIFEDIEALTGSTVREAGFLFEYNFETGVRRTVASFLPFGGQIECYFNGKLYLSGHFSNVGGLYAEINGVDMKKVKHNLIYCVDVKTGEFSMLNMGESAGAISVYNDKLYAVGQSGKLYECEPDLSGYSEYTSVSGSVSEIISMSDGVMYFIDDGTLYSLNIAKGEKTAEQIAENVHTVKSYAGDAYYAHADYRIIESGDLAMDAYTDGIIHRYDAETKETEVFLSDMGVDVDHIMYLDAKRIMYYGSYYGGIDAGYEYTGSGSVDCVYDFEKEDFRIIMEY